MGAFLKQLSNFIQASLRGALDPNYNVWEKMKEMEQREAMQLQRAEATALRMYSLTKDPKYLDKLEKIYEKQSNLIMANGRELSQFYKEAKEAVREMKANYYSQNARAILERVVNQEKLEKAFRQAQMAQAQKVAEQVHKIQEYFRQNYLKHGREALGLSELKKELENAKEKLQQSVNVAKTQGEEAKEVGKDKGMEKGKELEQDRGLSR